MGALVATNTGGYSEPVIYPLEDLQKPRIYLLDEPGEDDPKGTSQIREAIVVSALDPHAAAAALPKYSGEGQLVRVFVGNLRRKLGDDANNPTYIFTEPRVGYRMAKP